MVRWFLRTVSDHHHLSEKWGGSGGFGRQGPPSPLDHSSPSEMRENHEGERSHHGVSPPTPGVPEEGGRPKRGKDRRKKGGEGVCVGVKHLDGIGIEQQISHI